MYSKDEIKEIMSDEGIEYTCCCYMNPEDSEDLKLRQLMLNVRNAIEEVLNYLESD